MVALFSFCLLSTSVLLLFPNYSKWFPGFTFHITLKKWFLGIITFISVYAALGHQWRPEGTL